MKAFFFVLAVASLYGCGGSYGGGTTAPPTQNTNTPPQAGGISVENNSFNPSAKTVAVGTTVQWAWNSCVADPNYGGGTTCTLHSVTFDDGTGSVTQDHGTFSKVFNTAGTFNYHCLVHGSAMTGTITVQ